MPRRRGKEEDRNRRSWYECTNESQRERRIFHQNFGGEKKPLRCTESPYVNCCHMQRGTGESVELTPRSQVSWYAVG